MSGVYDNEWDLVRHSVGEGVPADKLEALCAYPMNTLLAFARHLYARSDGSFRSGVVRGLKCAADGSTPLAVLVSPGLVLVYTTNGDAEVLKPAPVPATVQKLFVIGGASDRYDLLYVTAEEGDTDVQQRSVRDENDNVTNEACPQRRNRYGQPRIRQGSGLVVPSWLANEVPIAVVRVNAGQNGVLPASQVYDVRPMLLPVGCIAGYRAHFKGAGANNLTLVTAATTCDAIVAVDPGTRFEKGLFGVSFKVPHGLVSDMSAQCSAGHIVGASHYTSVHVSKAVGENEVDTYNVLISITSDDGNGAIVPTDPTAQCAVTLAIDFIP